MQQQIEEKIRSIQEPASHFRSHLTEDAPRLVVEYLTKNGIDLNADLIIYHDMSSYEDCNAHGVFVFTCAGKFFDIEVDLDEGAESIEYSSIDEVTKNFPIQEHVPGKGVSDGWIYAKALANLNKAVQQGVQPDGLTEDDWP